MGFNYIYSQGKSHTKAWSEQFVRSAENLFATPQNQIERTFVATSRSPISVTERQAVHIRRVESKLVVYQGLTLLATAEKPSFALLEAVEAAHGVLEGVISEVIDAASLILVRVIEGGRQ